jgi:hypothetical protein
MMQTRDDATADHKAAGVFERKSTCVQHYPLLTERDAHASLIVTLPVHVSLKRK